MKMYEKICMFVVIFEIGTCLKYVCENGMKREDPDSIVRYFECHSDDWISNKCLNNQIFDFFLEQCVHFVKDNQTQSSNEFGHFQRNQTRRKRNAGVATGRKFKAVPRTVNGELQTTLYYYDKNGPNYKFTVRGATPAGLDKMLTWMENHKHLYQLTNIPYDGDANIPRQRFTNPFFQSRPTSSPTRPPTRQPSTAQPTQTHSFFSSSSKPTECGLSGKKLRDKIIGGSDGNIEDSPWQVAIIHADTNEQTCGGSILTKRHVLTATHCFLTRGSETLKIEKTKRLILAGRTFLKEDPVQKFVISELYLHTKYRLEHKRNDIALVVIGGEFSFNQKVFPICLPPATASYHTNRECKITGWGVTEEGKRHSEDSLRSAAIKITSAWECKEYNEKYLKIYEGMFCAGDFHKGGVDTCQGDSGGPLACEEGGHFYLYGITSYGRGCGVALHPGVYTRVARYRKWINLRMEVSTGMKNRDALRDEDDEDVTGNYDANEALIKFCRGKGGNSFLRKTCEGL